MSKKKKSDRKEIINEWLELYPLRKLEYEINKENQAVVLLPHSDNWLIRKIFPKPTSPAQKVRLDDVGTFVWEHCDGDKPVKKICEHLQEEFGDRVEPVEERTVIFLQQMYKQKFIRVYARKEPAQSGN